MAQIKQLKDTTGNFYPVTHKDAIVGIEDIQVDMTGYATELWVEELNYLTEHQDISNKVDVEDFEEATRVTAEALNLFHSNTLWQTEDTYVRCDKSKTLEEAVSGESDIVYFTTDSHQIVLNGAVYNLLDSEDYATKQWVEDKGYLTEHLDISGKVDVTKFEETNHVISTALNYLNDNKQDKTDTSLETENKTIVGAINEVNSKCGGSGADLSNYLPLTGGTMTGTIDFSFPKEDIHNILTCNDHYIFQFYDSTETPVLYIGTDTQIPVLVHQLISSNSITASGFKTTLGTNTQVLLADGSTKELSEITPNVDLSGYLPLSGGSMTGAINMNGNVLSFDEDRYTSIYENSGQLCLEADEGIVSTAPIEAPSFYETSDARKKDIKSDLSLDKCYDLIDKCQTVIYSLKDQTKEQVGMIAQEIEEFFPEVIATDEEGFKSLAYDRLVVICFKVLKDIIKRLEKLEQ